MGTHFVIPSIFTSVDQMSPTLQKMRGNLIGFGNSAEAALSRVDRVSRKLIPGLGDVQKQLLSMVGTGAAIAGAFQLGSFSFNSLADYETAVDSFRVIVSDLNDAQFAPFQNKINEVAKTTKRSGSEVAAAFEQIASKNAKFADTAQGLGQVTEASITLAKAARMDLGVAAENLVGIMNQFSFGADKADRTINALAAGQAIGAASITQTAESFVNLGPTAANANVTLEQSVGLIQTLAKFSLFGADAGTALRGSIIKLQKAGLGYKSGQFSINDALADTNALMAKLKTAKQKDALITSIFGIHNITAGQILVRNTDTIKEFTAGVTGTSEAQKGAAINSGNLRTTLQQLSAAWVNMLTTSDKVGTGMTFISNAAKWLTTNLDAVVSTVISAVKWYAIFRASMLAAKIAMFAWNVTLGISTAIQGASSLAMAGNTTALAAQKVALFFTRTALIGTTTATEAATVATWSLNAAWAANPVGIIVLAVAALTAGIWYLVAADQALTEEYERRSALNVTKSMDQEGQTVDALVQRYMKLGMSMKDATISAIQFERNAINLSKLKIETEITAIQNEIKGNQINTGSIAGMVDLPGTDALREKLLAKQQIKTGLFSESLALTNLAINKTRNEPGQTAQVFGEGDKFSGSELRGIMATNDTKSDPGEGGPSKTELTVKIKNDSESPVTVSNGKTRLFDVMPKMESTKVLSPLYGR